MAAPAFLIFYCLFPISHFWAESLALPVPERPRKWEDLLARRALGGS
jgi:hypothetical protein